MASIFSKIIAGEIPSYFVGEDDKNYAFLDINPVQKGHVLVVPKVETDRFFDLDAEELSSLVLFSQRVARALKKVVDCDRIGVTVIGLEVPHAHVHLIPINDLHDMDFTRGRVEQSSESMQELADRVRMAL